jgi:hypothetical protein
VVVVCFEDLYRLLFGRIEENLRVVCVLAEIYRRRKVGYKW